MSESIIPTQAASKELRVFGAINSFVRRSLLGKLQSLRTGRLVVVENGERYVFGEEVSSYGTVHIRVKEQRFYEYVAFAGTVGAGEAYIRGLWECDDLTLLIRIILANRQVMDDMESGLAKLSKPFLRMYHNLRKNTVDGSRKNIAAHYDLGNEFYQLFLDETMTYSSGVFLNEQMSLQEASVEKLDRLCRKLSLNSNHHILEIGTGWGSFAIHAARNYGCHVTTTTISQKQYDLAKARIEEAGLSDKITLLLQDYRELEGQFDHIVSVEMIEAVGWQFYGTFMHKCSSLLRPEGMIAMQAITIQEQVFDDARRSVDYIQRFIFPGSCIPSITSLIGAAKEHSDLNLVHLEDFGNSYARTLKIWRERFFEKIEEVRELGYSEEFIRMWEFYLCYCEGGFLERNIGCCQMVLSRPGSRHEPLLNVN